MPVRHRHDGWTAARQVTFLQVLAETGCIEEAARAVGMSARSAYTLKARADAGSFRQAWDVSLDFAVGRLGDTMLGRAINGEVTPVFYKGEQVGERRRYDNRLGMWILQYRQSERYGCWRAKLQTSREHPDGAAMMMGEAIGRVASDAGADDAGQPRTPRAPLRTTAFSDDPDLLAAQDRMREQREEAAREADMARYWATLDERAGKEGRGGFADGPARTS